MKKLLFYISVVAGSIVLLLALVAFATQTDIFREKFLPYAVENAKTFFNGNVFIGNIRGNLITGFETDSLYIEIDNAPFIETSRAKFSYGIISALRGRYILRSVELLEPRIHIHATRDGKWNYNKFASTDTSSAPPNTYLQLRHFVIANGELFVLDSSSLTSTTVPYDSVARIHLNNLHITNLNINLTGKIDKTTYEADIENLSCELAEPKFLINRFSGKFLISPTRLSLEGVEFQTEKSKISLSARLDSVNILEPISVDTLKHKKVFLSMFSLGANSEELALFLPSFSSVKGVASFNVRATGELGKISLEQFEFGAFESTLKCNGEIDNLTQPESLRVDVKKLETSFQVGDVVSLAPLLALPSFPNVGNITMTGGVLFASHNLNLNLKIQSKAGNFETKGMLAVTSPRLKYNAKISGHAVVLEDFLEATDEIAAGGSSFQSRLNFSADISGEGTSPDSLVSSVHIAIDSSSLQRENGMQYEIKTLTCDATANNGTFTVATVLETGEGNGTIHATAVLSHNQFISLASDGKIEHLNAGHVLQNEKYQSDLSFEYKGKTKGATLDELTAEAAIHFLPSTFANRAFGSVQQPIAESNLLLSLNQEDPENKTLEVQSAIADMRIKGMFDLHASPAFLLQQVEKAARAFTSSNAGEHVQDSLNRMPISKDHDVEKINFSFDIALKNIEPVSLFIDNISPQFKGTINGRMDNRGDSLNVFADVAFDSAHYVERNADKEQAMKYDIQAKSAAISFDVTMPTLKQGSEYVYANISANIVSAAYNGTPLDSITLKAIVENKKGTFSANVIVSNAYKFSTQAVMQTDTDHVNFSCSPFTFTKGNYRWNNFDTMHIKMFAGSFRFDNCTLQRDVQRVRWSGDLIADTMNFSVEMKKFSLDQLPLLTSDDDSVKESEHLNGRVDATVLLGGTFFSPIIHCSASSPNTGLRGVTQGTILFEGAYANKVMNTKLSYVSNDSTHPFHCNVNGDLPIDLSFTPIEQRFTENNMNLHMVADSVPLALLDPFVPKFDNITGMLNCSLDIGGTTSRPNYIGTIQFRDGKFQYEDNKMWYTFNGSLKGEGKRMRLANMLVENDKNDRPDGLMKLDGYFSLHGITIDSIDAKATGQLLVLKPTVRKVKSGAYGNLFLSTDASGITYRGTFERSILQGTIYVQDADLTFPPVRENDENSSTVLQVVTIDDTSKIILQNPNALPTKFFKEKKKVVVQGQVIQQKSLGNIILDGMTVDMTVETKGTNQIKMIFSNNPATSEELYAELDGKLIARKTTEGIKFIGDINIGERSYYNFFKRFSASGVMRFTGDPQNPELDLTAVHEAIHTDQTNIDKKVLITMKITGTRTEPKVAFSSMKEVSGQDTIDFVTKGKDVQSDAISFLITGKYRDELTSGERSQLVQQVSSSVSNSVVTGFTNSVLSGMLTEFLRDEFSFIRSAEISYAGGNVSNDADVRLSGEVFKAYWRFGGRILNDIGRANVSFQIPLGEVLKSRSINNLFIEVERKVEESEFYSERKLTNTARLFYKFSY